MRFQPALKLHQQHLTDRKLPSPWPAGRHSRGYDFGILRHMTAGLAESGE